MLLGVHRKSARYAVLGELGRFPLLLRALKHAIKYEWRISHESPHSSLISQAFGEMKQMSDRGIDCWYSRILKLKNLFEIPEFGNFSKSDTVGRKINSQLQNKFSYFWKVNINKFKQSPHDDLDHNKLRFYKTLKSSFSMKPYLSLVKNRNQRAWISRIRISAHSLHIETARYTRPVTPANERFCNFCNIGSLDDECHLLTCSTFLTKTNCLFGRVLSINSKFMELPIAQKLIYLLCPAESRVIKLFNKYIGIIFDARNRIANGDPMDRGQFQI